YWLTLVLAENAVALLFARRHPIGALAGVLATFFAFDNPATMALPLALALLTVMTAVAGRRTALAALVTALVVVVAPILHRDSSAPARAAIGLLAVALIATLGRRLRRQQDLPNASRLQLGHARPTTADSDPANAVDVVETERLTKRFGDAAVVSDVDLRVPCGTAFGYLGPNGAGKTTLIRMLLGLTKPTD